MSGHTYHDSYGGWVAVCDVDGCDWRRDGLSFDEATVCVNAHQAYHRVRAAVAAQEAITSVIDQIRNGPTMPPAGSDARGGAGDVPVACPADQPPTILRQAVVTFTPPPDMDLDRFAREVLCALDAVGARTIDVDGQRWRMTSHGTIAYLGVRDG